jgi:gliding motility-associated-like protein
MKPTGVALLILTISFCVHTSLRAAVFTVTSKADSGPGTLREAITRANSNGTATKDFIYFNLPGISLADVTIQLNTDLPALAGNVSIDASTQSSPILGNSGARVRLYRDIGGGTAVYYGLKIDNAQQVEIYGLAIKSAPTTVEGYGIMLSGVCSDIIIGGTGKGNVINSFKYGVYGMSATNPQPVSNITIQCNIIGFEEDGAVATTALSCYQPILLHHLNGVVLGGNRADLGNVMIGNTYGVSLNIDMGSVVVSFNKAGTDINGIGLIDFNLSNGAMIDISGNASGSVLISDNHIAGNSIQGLALTGVQNGNFRIVRNRIGPDAAGQVMLGQRSSGLLIRDCGPGLVGGSLSDKNIIAGCLDAPVAIVNAYRVTVSQNEMFCNNTTTQSSDPANSIALGNWNAPDGRPKPFVHVTACNTTTLSGTATPNAKMEVFSAYRCSAGAKCDGRNYIETFFAGADGRWTYALKGRDGVILSATDAAGATSDYSNPVWSTDIPDNIINTACGKSTGSIRNSLLYNATPFHWEDDAGNTVGTDTSLVNVPAGRYRLVMYGAGCNKPACVVYSPFFEVADVSPAIMTGAVTIQPATCGLNNGSISGLQFRGINLKYQWFNAANQVIGNNAAIAGLTPGTYTLVISDTVNGCAATGGPYEIKGIAAPVLDATGLVLKNAICSQPTGSITGLKVTGTGTITYTWTNANQVVAGNTLDLVNVPAGQYTLSFTDASACPAAPSGPYTVTAPGLITIDRSNLAIRETDCAVSNGSITGLQATNATTIRWLDRMGTVVGNSLDLANMPAGSYILEITNATGCNATATFIIPQHLPAILTVTQLNKQNPVCNLQNGSATGLVLTGGTPVSYRWVDQSGTEVSQDRELINMGDGVYKLYVTDIERCEQLVTTVTLRTPNLPVIDERYASVIHDVCNTISGMIGGITVSGIAPFSYAWLNEDSAVIATDIKAQGLPHGTYTLQTTDGNGCIVYSSPFLIEAVDILLLAPRVKDVTIMRGMTAHLKVTNAHQGVYYLFEPGTEWSQTSTTGEFSLTGITESKTFGMNYTFGDCESPPAYVRVEVIDKIKVVAPTAFSPNGDGHNDIFKPRGYGVAAYTLFTVMDRWGNCVFSTRDIDAGWDGTFHGKKVEAGGYVWMMQGIDILGLPVQEKGAVLVIY